MIFVDSSVWIDFFKGIDSTQARWLHDALGARRIVVGDLVLAEVLQGIRGESDAARVQAELLNFPIVEVAGRDIALQSARNDRLLRSRGITIRKTIDLLIATRCIVEGWRLLHRDRHFEPFIAELGLVSALGMS